MWCYLRTWIFFVLFMNKFIIIFISKEISLCIYVIKKIKFWYIFIREKYSGGHQHVNAIPKWSPVFKNDTKWWFSSHNVFVYGHFCIFPSKLVRFWPSNSYMDFGKELCEEFGADLCLVILLKFLNSCS